MAGAVGACCLALHLAAVQLLELHINQQALQSSQPQDFPTSNCWRSHLYGEAFKAHIVNWRLPPDKSWVHCLPQSPWQRPLQGHFVAADAGNAASVASSVVAAAGSWGRSGRAVGKGQRRVLVEGSRQQCLATREMQQQGCSLIGPYDSRIQWPSIQLVVHTADGRRKSTLFSHNGGAAEHTRAQQFGSSTAPSCRSAAVPAPHTHISSPSVPLPPCIRRVTMSPAPNAAALATRSV